MRVFGAWLAVFYAVWLSLVIAGGHLATLAAHWPIAVAMAAGSFVAGSTPMGGGTVGFPILVLLMDQPATLGRDFSFAVQSVGMTSATIYILCRRLPLAWSVLSPALVGACLGTPPGILLLAPHAPGLGVKLLFAVMWVSFGLLHLVRLGEIGSFHGNSPATGTRTIAIGFAVGLFGSATVASITGVGIDMLIYTVLILLFRVDARIAIPTSVVLMAFVSVLGIGLKIVTGSVDPDVFGHWLAAAPVVVVGAPLGALVVNAAGRRPALIAVSLLCVGQFLWTLWHERASLSGSILLLTVLSVVVCLAIFEAIRRAGRQADQDSAGSSGRGSMRTS